MTCQKRETFVKKTNKQTKQNTKNEEKNNNNKTNKQILFISDLLILFISD